MKRALAITLVCLLGACLLSSCDVELSQDMSCDTRDHQDIVVLFAQAVPSATSVPCVATLPAGWHFDSSDVRSGSASFSLDNDVAGDLAVTVSLTSSCDTRGAVEVPTTADETGLRRLELPQQLSGGYQATRFYVFDGGCISYHFAFLPGASSVYTAEADSALSFVPRTVVRRVVQQQLGVELCGAGAPPCPGSTGAP